MVDRGWFHAMKDLSFVDQRVLANAPTEEARQLPEDFQPGTFDVICSRGSDSYNHPGNRRFRQKVDQTLGVYSKASSKLEKSMIVTKVIDGIRESGGMFIRQDAKSKRWHEVGDRLAREKAGQAIRACLRKKPTPTATQPPKSPSPSLDFAAAQPVLSMMNPFVADMQHARESHRKSSAARMVESTTDATWRPGESADICPGLATSQGRFPAPGFLNQKRGISSDLRSVSSRSLPEEPPAPPSLLFSRANTDPLPIRAYFAESARQQQQRLAATRPTVSSPTILAPEPGMREGNDPLMEMAVKLKRFSSSAFSASSISCLGSGELFLDEDELMMEAVGTSSRPVGLPPLTNASDRVEPFRGTIATASSTKPNRPPLEGYDLGPDGIREV